MLHNKEQSVHNVYNLYQLLLAKVKIINININNLNHLSFIPSKSQDQIMLNDNLLQLSANTLLILNELSLTSGTLTAKGQANVAMLQKLLKSQILDYKFPYSTFEFYTNHPIIKLTYNAKGSTFLPCTFMINIATNAILDQQQVDQAATKAPTADLIAKWRQYITYCSNLSIQMSSQVEQIFTQDFLKDQLKYKAAAIEFGLFVLNLTTLNSKLNFESQVTIQSYQTIRQLINEFQI